MYRNKVKNNCTSIEDSNALGFCYVTSDWITSKICDSISYNILSEIV